MTTAVLSGLSSHEFRSFIEGIRGTKPPFTCPIEGCDKIYKSFSGIHTHLSKFSHDAIIRARANENGKHESGAVMLGSSNGFGDGTMGLGHHGSWNQAQKIIDVEVNGKMVRLNILEPMPLSFVSGNDKNSKAEEKRTENMVPVPRAVFREVSEFAASKIKPPPISYIRYIERTAEEMDEEIEYDMDEEDDAWLEVINEKRVRVGLPRVSEATFELIMNRFEKDSYFKTTTASQQAANDGGPFLKHDDDDAVCCVCGDGECDNANAILFCDMCNLAVHQECYGVPYIPEGQWLCRRCQLSPSQSADCRLCPNKGGAFKVTSDNGWAHVVCALWVPEVQFANTVFLEPIEGFDRVPAARWKLACYICKQKSRGACIQCHKPSCYTAFHVTCAQQAGLYMKMETVSDGQNGDGDVSVRKSAFCDVHTPPSDDQDVGKSPDKKNRSSDSISSKFNMRRARKLLNQKRNSSPIVSVPVMPRRKLSALSHQLKLAGKQEFLDRILRYWTLKRRSRFGVPLLRRLQVTHHASRLEKERLKNRELQSQIKNWRQLRQDLEKARLLMELVRKREKKKKENLNLDMEIWKLMLWSPQKYLLRTLDRLLEIDEMRVFAEPVDEAEVPGYYRIIKSPMDLQTMREKVEQLEYKDFAQFERDYDLMMANCMKFNSQNEYYRNYGQTFKKQGKDILREASEEYSTTNEFIIKLLNDLQKQKLKDSELVSATESAVSSEEDTKLPSEAETEMHDIVTEAAKSLPAGRRGRQKSITQQVSPTVPNCPPTSSKEKPQQKRKSDATSVRPTPKRTMPKTGRKSAGKPTPSAKITPASEAKTPGRRSKKRSVSIKSNLEEKSEVDDEDEDDDAKPLTLYKKANQQPKSMLNSLRRPGGANETVKMNSSSFRRFREDAFAAVTGLQRKITDLFSRNLPTALFNVQTENDTNLQERKSPNSSAVESEIEVIGDASASSGDESAFKKGNNMISANTDNQSIIGDVRPEHLDFIWAHIDGEPWMPGVIIDPAVDYCIDSVVKYIPPRDILDKKHDDDAYLVMLFDEQQSWHWLKEHALTMLGLEQDLDTQRIREAGQSRRVVMKAYERASIARRQVMGDTDDGDSSETNNRQRHQNDFLRGYRSSEDGSDFDSAAPKLMSNIAACASDSS